MEFHNVTICLLQKDSINYLKTVLHRYKISFVDEINNTIGKKMIIL
jgi:hypothetical protein